MKKCEGILSHDRLYCESERFWGIYMVNGVKNNSSIDRMSQMEAIVTEYETPLLRYATRILHNHTAAQDVIQNVFIKLFKNLKEGMHSTKHLKGWLYRVAHNEAVDYIRRESRLTILHSKHAEEFCDDGVHCELSSVNDDRKAMVLLHLSKLHPREQQVVLLRIQEGLSYKEISNITGRSEGNVGNILHHAVRKLANSINKSMAGES